MELKKLSVIFALLLGVGIIFGTFEAAVDDGAFVLGFAWFTNMLWFAIGFPVLIIIALLIFSAGIKGEEKMEKEG